MPTALLIVVVALYMAASAILSLFAANLVLFSWRTWRARRDPEPTGVKIETYPQVTIQLPVYNELYVVERAIGAILTFDWPRDRMQIQVLDDSTDETTLIIAELVSAAREDGFDIEHLHRSNRVGYKAGALGEGMKSAKGELIAIFDADFVPPTDFLQRTVPHFDSDHIAFVQARWGHLNRNHSWITRVQSIALDAHFLIDQANRGQAGYWFNFNGTAGIWRAAAIHDAGGWQADTLTEDLDLSYRAHLRGWRARYLKDLEVPAELPAQITGFRRQQHRWARGTLECAIRLLPRVWKTDVAFATRWQATVHLTSHAAHLLLVLLVLLYPPLSLAAIRIPGSSNLFGFGYLFGAMAITPTLFFATGQLIQDRRRWRELPWILMVTIFAAGLMLNTARAFVQIFTKPKPEFERTAKFGIDDQANRGTAVWTRKRYQLDLDRIVWAELALGIYAYGAAAYAAVNGTWGIFAFALIFGTGLMVMSIASISHAGAVRRAAKRRSETIRNERRELDLVRGNTDLVRRAIVVMAKRPAAGRTKTRLTPTLTDEQAADLYESFLLDIVDTLQERNDVSLFIAIDEPESAEWFAQVAPTVPQLPQIGNDLGQRLDSVMSECLNQRYDQVFAISSDSPDLPADHLTTAFAQLDDPDTDVVLGPTEDGGYYLIGWKQRWAPMVTNVKMSTPQVLADTLAVADELDATVALAPMWYDIDVPSDLERLRASLDLAAGPDHPASRTASFLATL